MQRNTLLAPIDFAVGIAEASLAAASVCLASLPGRFAASLASADVSFQLLAAGVCALGRNARLSASSIVKALDAAAEEERARAAQLHAYAQLLDNETEYGDLTAITACSTLLDLQIDHVGSFLRWEWKSGAVRRAADVTVRDGVDVSRCAVSGDGLTHFHPGGGDNVVAVEVSDEDGDVVPSLEGGDVTVCVFDESGSVCFVGAGETGRVPACATYRVPASGTSVIQVSVSVCGAPLPGSHFSVPLCPLGDSLALAAAPSHFPALLTKLSVWLPGRRAYTLLYRGSRDGMSAAAFHSRCDGKGPTLVLVRCTKGWVFGGYAGTSWESSGRLVASPDAFVMSVKGPLSGAPARFPVRPEHAHEALSCPAHWGPSFYCGLYVLAEATLTRSYRPGGGCCYVGVDSKYEDVLGMAPGSIVDEYPFYAAEVEVYGIALA
ncbi:MAG: TLD domain-containing protein [Terracidiphilus sp.]|nr:TLD domain-containing protein [Terracidiphilus sp.]